MTDQKSNILNIKICLPYTSQREMFQHWAFTGGLKWAGYGCVVRALNRRCYTVSKSGLIRSLTQWQYDMDKTHRAVDLSEFKQGIIESLNQDPAAITRYDLKSENRMYGVVTKVAPDDAGRFIKESKIPDIENHAVRRFAAALLNIDSQTIRPANVARLIAKEYS